MEGAEGAAAVGAASPGAPEGREKKIEHPKGSSRDASLSSDCKSPSRQASDVEVQVRDYTWESDAEPEAAREAASGAFGALPPDLRGTSAGDQARASTADRQVHFCDVRWPVLRGARFCSQKSCSCAASEFWSWPAFCSARAGQSRTRRRSKMEFRTRCQARDAKARISMWRGRSRRRRCTSGACSERSSRASETIRSERFFCEAFPSLEPASGGAPRAESVDRRRPIWETLRRTWRVHACHDFLTTHLCDKHDDGEVRLLSQKDMRASAVGRRRPQPGLLVAPAREGRGVATAAQGETCD